MARIIYIDGREEEIQDPLLENMQEIVGGYIEDIRLPNGKVMIVNEEGLLLRLDINKKATDYLLQFKGDMRYFPKIVGNVVILNNDEAE